MQPPSSRVVVGGIVVDSNGAVAPAAAAGPYPPHAVPPGYPPPMYPAPMYPPPGYAYPHGVHPTAQLPPPQQVPAPPPPVSLTKRVDDSTAMVMARPGFFGALSMIGAGATLTVGALMVLVFGAPIEGVVLGAGFGASVMGGLGTWLLKQRGKLRGRLGVEPALQLRILESASKTGGRLTVTSTARALMIPLEDAEAALNAMSKSGYVDVEIEPSSGVMVYVFREMDPRPSAPRHLPAPAAAPTPAEGV